MLKSFLKTTLRTIRKSPLTSFINIFGLAAALGVAIMCYSFVSYDLNTDQFHENREEIYMATTVLSRTGEEANYGITPVPYSERLRNDFPQIKRVVRMENRNGIMRAGLKVFNERISFADPGFLDMFTFPLKWGNKSSLEEPNKIILSEFTATKYFGDTNPVGEAITFDFGDKKYTFEVGGVAEKFPPARSMDFRALVNFDQIEIIDPSFRINDWSRFLDATFIQLENPNDLSSIEQSVQQFVSIQNDVQKDWPATEFGFTPWTRVFLDGNDLKNTVTGGTDGLARLVLSIIGAFILVLAVFNYINIAIVSATKRLKEIGVRKVMGGTRKSLITQFLSENVFMTLVALILGFVLAVTLLIPGFDNLFQIGMEFDIAHTELWIFLLILVVFTGLASGAYPALYISNFSAVNIFRGRLRFGGKNRLTKAFLTFQYILACIAVVGGIMFTQNTAYQRARDWGYDKDLTLAAYLDSPQELMQLKAVMEQNPNIESIAGSTHHLNRGRGSLQIETMDLEKRDIVTLEIGPNYIETMKLNLLEGRSFEERREADFQNVVVNEKMARVLNPNGALGSRFKVDSVTYTVIGIVEDFHQWSFFDPIEPMILKLAREDQYAYLSMKVKDGTLLNTHESLENSWTELFPDKPYNGFYQESTLEWYFREIDGHGKLMRYVATLCIILSCLGLYGLVSLNVASRTKEFSIRKALGAGLKNLALVINRQFVVFMIIALVLGLPISYVLMDALFEAVYAYYKPITIIPFLMAMVMVVLMVFLTVSSQVKKVMTTSPTEGLRSE